MKIQISTGRVLSPDATGKYREAYKLYRELSGGKAEPYDSIDWISFGIYDYVAPVVGVNQKETVVIVVVDATTRTFEVVDLTAQVIADNASSKLKSDLQQATISSAILIAEVFNQLNVSGALDASALSQKAKDEFAALTALVNSYIP